VAEVQVLLRKIAGHFGHDENDTANYNTKFRNPVLSQFSTGRRQIIYAVHGIDGVGAEVEKLKQAGMSRYTALIRRRSLCGMVSH
jgi:hypothetical protein